MNFSDSPRAMKPDPVVVRPPGFDLLLRVRQTEEPMLVKAWGVQGLNLGSERGHPIQ